MRYVLAGLALLFCCACGDRCKWGEKRDVCLCCLLV